MTKVVKRLEEFNIPGFRSCIIDEGNVFHEDKGFQAWVGGGGIGYSLTIEEARKEIFDLAIVRIKENIVKAKKAIKLGEDTINKLGKDVFNLGQFKTKMKPHYTYKDKEFCNIKENKG